MEVGQGKKGSDGKWIPISSVKKGDTVMLGEWSGSKVKVNEKELLIVNEEDILGIVEMDKK